MCVDKREFDDSFLTMRKIEKKEKDLPIQFFACFV